MHCKIIRCCMSLPMGISHPVMKTKVGVISNILQFEKCPVSAQVYDLLSISFEVKIVIQVVNQNCEFCQILVWPWNTEELSGFLGNFSERFMELNTIFIPSHGNRFSNRDIAKLSLTLASRLFTFSTDQGLHARQSQVYSL